MVDVWDWLSTAVTKSNSSLTKANETDDRRRGADSNGWPCPRLIFNMEGLESVSMIIKSPFRFLDAIQWPGGVGTRALNADEGGGGAEGEGMGIHKDNWQGQINLWEGAFVMLPLEMKILKRMDKGKWPSPVRFVESDFHANACSLAC